MKRLFLVLPALAGLLAGDNAAAAPPRGRLLEVHSCELYAGGCVVSSEATLGGRHLLRAWSFTGGSFAGTDFAGLKLALLQSSGENLADRAADPGHAVVYLPDTATARQREALMAWLASAEPRLIIVQTRLVPLEFAKTGSGYCFSAGRFVAVQTAPVTACETGACGEALWYTPVTPASMFTVAVAQSAQVTEPALELKWRDAGKRSVFLARFGANGLGQDLFMAAPAELCGRTGNLF